MPELVLAGTRIHYREAGSGPALLLIHGLGSSGRDWESQIPEFARHFRTIAPDLRGYGHSEAHAPFSIERFSADCWALLDSLGIPETHIVGYSMGGAVAMQMTLGQQSRVRRLVISNSVPSFRPQTTKHHLMLWYRLLTMSLLGPAVLAQASTLRMFPKPEHAALREKNARRASHNSRRVYLKSLLALTGWSVIDRLSELKLPVKVVAAEHDYFAREDFIKFAYALPRGRLRIFPDTHHGLPQESPEEYNTAVLNFLLSERG
jgi:pimeloyl-ACP methyl ester carboxylesterase